MSVTHDVKIPTEISVLEEQNVAAVDDHEECLYEFVERSRLYK